MITPYNRIIKCIIACIIVALSGCSAEAESNLNIRRALYPSACPQNCVFASFEFQVAVTECSACMPRSSKWLCPTKGNKYESRVPGGFGDWGTNQCVRKKYEPSILAFSGPGAYDEYVFPSCPTASFCACGAMREKINALMFNRQSLGKREGNDLWWAAHAENFQLVNRYEGVSGASYENFNLLYTHSDGRKQFCSGVQSFTFSPQNDLAKARYQPRYETSCGFNINECDHGFQEVGKVDSDCWFTWLGIGRTVCEAITVSTITQPASVENPGDHLESALSVKPEFGPFGPYSSCTKKCGSGSKTKTRICSRGTGDFVGEFCEGSNQETVACNTQECKTSTTGCSYFPSCPSGFEKTSSEWCSWGRRKFHCKQTA